MKKASCAAILLLSLLVGRSQVTVGPWVPIFKGIDHANGYQNPSVQGQLRITALRIDLLDPDVELFSTPSCTNCGKETFGQSTSLFLQTYQLQVAVNASFFDPCCSATPGTPMDVTGLAISRGQVVSPQDTAVDATVALFTTNKHLTIIATNWPPTNTAGIYTAITGHYPLLANGVNLGPNYLNDPDPRQIHQPQPRTALGISQDKRYLILIVIDGRQSGWSDGSTDIETADWLARFGAYDGINLDGGGSATMVMSDCYGDALELNRPSDLLATGHERVIGNNFGVFAKPLQAFINDVDVSAQDTYATVTWTTISNATTQVEYGTNSSYGSSTVLDTTPVTSHAALLNGLTPQTTNYYRVVSTVGGTRYESRCFFVTTKTTHELLNITNAWKYTTNNLDSINWQATGYNDSTWLGPGPALLYVEDNVNVNPKNTPLPGAPGALAPTYYFRTHFFLGQTNGVTSLIFTNYVDDGAVFYLNGVEVNRMRMPATPAVITYTTLATQTPCLGDATCFTVFILTGASLSALRPGDNVVAAEVHQTAPTGTDIVFGSALNYVRPTIYVAPLSISQSGPHAKISWLGNGFTLQRAGAPTGTWGDVPGPITNSPYRFDPSIGAGFYRLRN